jgi:5'-nucleotidase
MLSTWMRKLPLLLLAILIAGLVSTGYDPLAVSAQANNVASFKPLVSFGVPTGVAEIVAATPDGNFLAYSNSTHESIGIVAITDVNSPQLVGDLAVGGQPTSVDISPDGGWAVAAVLVDQPAEGELPPDFGPGALVVIDISDPANAFIVGRRDIGYQPDSIKLTEVGGSLIAVVAIENQPVVTDPGTGLVTGDDAPGSPYDVSPAGLIQVISVDTADPASSLIANVALPEELLSAAGLLFAGDPQPEYVAISGTDAAVSLQENNGIARIDISDPANPVLVGVFSTGIVSNRLADLTGDSSIAFTELYPAAVNTPEKPSPTDAGGNPVPAGVRMPDAIAFTPDGTALLSADEGEMDFTGGRGWTSWSPNGVFLWDDDGSLEAAAVTRSHYPEGRSDARGIEVEGIATDTFGGQDFAFVLSERGSFMAVYDITDPAAPGFIQLLPTGISPEGIATIPSRNLVVTSDEVSGTLTLFQGVADRFLGTPEQPTLSSSNLQTPWAAVSGLSVAGRSSFFGVPDNAVPTEIYRIDLDGPEAEVSVATRVRIQGRQARYDGEGIANDTSILGQRRWNGWWIASEGDAGTNPNLLVQVDRHGRVQREIQLPPSIDPAADPSLPGNAQGPANGGTIRSNGFEGVAVSRDGRFLLAAVQREFANGGAEFPTGDKFTRIAVYDLRQLDRGRGRFDWDRDQQRGDRDRKQDQDHEENGLCRGIRCGGDWQFYFYPLDSNDPDNWAGLSEIIPIGRQEYAVIERDGQIGVASQLKKIYSFSLADLEYDSDGMPGGADNDTVSKVLVLDVLDEFFPYEKIEGLALMRNGDPWIGLDNDGGEVESRLLNTAAFFGDGIDDPDQLVQLQLLAFNDYHGHLEANTPGTVDGVPAGGSEYLAAMLAQLREGHEHSLTVAAGDLIGGSPAFSGLFHDEPAVESLNALGLDVSSVGNHEFDEGVPELLRMQNGGCHPIDGCYFPDQPYPGADFQWLAANVVNQEGDTPLPSYWVREIEGVKVGFIGMTLEATDTIVAAAGIQGWDFLDEAETANALVPILQAEDVEAIIVLLHEGGSQTPPTGDINACVGISGPIVAINEALSPEIDAVITGHTHLPYNCLLDDPDGDPRIVTSAYSYGRVVSELDLVLDRRTGEVRRDLSAASNHTVAQESLTPDPALAAIIQKWQPLVDAAGSSTVGTITETILRGGASPGSDRGVESAAGNLIADAQLWATSSNGAQIAFMNPGGVRSNLEYPQSADEGDGVVTFGEAFTFQPFGNTLVTFPMTGAQVVSVLEEQCQPLGSSSPFLHLGASEGFTYDLSRTIEAGDCTSVTVSNLRLNGVELDPAATYNVTVNSFLADGGDNFTTFGTVTAPRLEGGNDLQALVNYLGTFSPVSPPSTDRVNLN